MNGSQGIGGSAAHFRAASFTRVIVSVMLLMTIAACATTANRGARLFRQTGVITDDHVRTVQRVTKRFQRAFEGFTPEQEYYIGRAVGAEILSRYEPYEDEAANRYLNMIGQSLALASHRPELFHGYRFHILDSEEVNAFATPSGLVMVTRGALRLTESEDCVAAILAHEIGHIEQKHGLQAIRTSRFNDQTISLLSRGTHHLTGEDLELLTETFEASIGDVTSTLINSGYSREAERQADEAAVRIMASLGYEPRALVKVLQVMDESLGPQTAGFRATHPPPSERIDFISREVFRYRQLPEPPAVRQDRYTKALGSI